MSEPTHSPEFFRAAGAGYATFSAPLIRYALAPGATRVDLFSDHDLDAFHGLLFAEDLAVFSAEERAAALASARAGFDQVVALFVVPELHAPTPAGAQ